MHISKSAFISHHSPLFHKNALLFKLNYLQFSDYIMLFYTCKIHVCFFFYNTFLFFILLTLVFQYMGHFLPGISRCSLNT